MPCLEEAPSEQPQPSGRRRGCTASDTFTIRDEGQVLPHPVEPGDWDAATRLRLLT
jgi:hypothetical protein